MNTKRHKIKLLVVVFFGILCVACLGTAIAFGQLARLRAKNATGVEATFKHDGKDRRYRIHVPKSVGKDKAAPLVLMFHGGGGSAIRTSGMGMTRIADREGFIVVYPNAVEKLWNDRRDSVRHKDHLEKINDVDFIDALIKDLKSKHNIDADRVFAFGSSNGGFLTQTLAIEKSEVFSAVAVVIATMAEPLNKTFAPKEPMSILFMNGTKDPMVPYDGGEIVVKLFPKLPGRGPSRGKCISTDAAIDLWKTRNGGDEKANTIRLPDSDPKDGTTIDQTVWKNGERDTVVMLYKVNGGGHNMPSASRYLPERIIGKTSQDMVGLEAIWTFFKEHARQPRR